ncbi:MAG: cell division protein FtsQ/DivIB [Gammaproteobacteria bacterium]|nr:cell division protein FtsQ/DivIB [Gammaproteobacteria bacterium]
MFRRRNRKRRERVVPSLPAIDWRGLVVAVAAVATLAGGYFGIVRMLNRPIDTLVVNGTFRRISPIQLEALIEPYTRVGFLDVDLSGVRRDLVDLPWVAGAEVRRRWPGTLLVEVREETPVACWGERGLLNADGQLFIAEADHVPAELPRLSGPRGTEAQVTARYYAVQRELEHRGMGTVTMQLDERGAWTFTTSSGVQVRLGSQAVDERIVRFFHALDSTLAHLPGEVHYVDMRYPNGFAIGWKRAGAVQATATMEQEPNA